jgi:hypothetical protein
MTIEELSDRVSEDPALLPEEKETQIRWAADEGKARIHTDEGSIIRRLLHHPEFTVGELTVVDTTGGPRDLHHVQVDKGTDLCDVQVPAGVVTGVRGSIPIGAITVQNCTRDGNQHYKAVSRRVLA